MERWTAVDESLIYPGGEFNGTPYALWRCDDEVVMILAVSAPQEAETRAAVLAVARQEIQAVFYGRERRDLSVGIVFLDEVLALGSLERMLKRIRERN
jgi:hypothetical protein